MFNILITPVSEDLVTPTIEIMRQISYKMQ